MIFIIIIILLCHFNICIRLYDALLYVIIVYVDAKKCDLKLSLTNELQLIEKIKSVHHTDV